MANDESEMTPASPEEMDDQGDLPTASGFTVFEAASASSVIRVLVLADLVGSTRLVETMGDSRAFELAGRHDRLARDLLARYDGLEIDKTDGFLLLFERPADAVCFALGYHQALARLAQEDDFELQARVGIHLGEVYLRRNPPEDVERGAKPLEVEGLAKPVAARVMSLAAGRQTLLTRGAFDLARRAAVTGELAAPELRWLAHGSYVAKGVDEALEIFEVGVKDFAPLLEPADTGKVRRAVAIGDELTLGWRPAAGQAIPRRPNWTLAERIGEGGFGEVWLAEHKSGEQRVYKFCFEAVPLRALKREVTLFRLMKEALGHRKDIARIVDWSFDQAPYFLEAEYTEGGNLAQWARKQGGLGAVSLETRLELVAQVAEALQAAHSVGILHKDVKPENVLVVTAAGDQPRIQLTDFGVGMLTDKNALEARGLTAAGFTEAVTDGSSASGTRRYMAPELIEGKTPTVQADLYSLGVMLYQVIAGDFTRTLASGWRREVRDELLAEDIALLVDGTPERRPESALEVARRLRALEERHRQRAAARHAARWRRRRRWLAAAAAAVLFVATIITIQATLARREADRLRAQSLRLRSEAEQLVSFLLGDLHNKLQPIGRLDILDEAGDKALAYFESQAPEDLTQNTLAQYAKALQQVGDVRMAQGDLDEALRLFQQSLAKGQALTAREPDNNEWIFNLSQSHFWVGNVLYRQREFQGALEEMRAYRDLALELAAREPNNSKWLLEVAYGHNNVGDLLQRLEDPAALESLRDALEVSRQLAELDPSNKAWQMRLGTARLQLGDWYRTHGSDLQAAMSHFREALEVIADLTALHPEDTVVRRRLVWAYERIGNVQLATGALSEALVSFENRLEVMSGLVAVDPSNVEVQRFLAFAHSDLGRVLTYREEHATALEHFQAAIDALDPLLESRESSQIALDLTNILSRMGYALLQGGNFERAEHSAQRAVSFTKPENGGGVGGSAAAEAFLLLGDVLAESGRSSEARAAWEKARTLLMESNSNLRNYKVADPWVRTLLSLDQVEEAKATIFTLLGMGYRDPRFLEICAANGLEMAIL